MLRRQLQHKTFVNGRQTLPHDTVAEWNVSDDIAPPSCICIAWWHMRSLDVSDDCCLVLAYCCGNFRAGSPLLHCESISLARRKLGLVRQLLSGVSSCDLRRSVRAQERQCSTFELHRGCSR